MSALCFIICKALSFSYLQWPSQQPSEIRLWTFDLQFKYLFFVLPKLVRSRAGPDIQALQSWGFCLSEVVPLGSNSLRNINVQKYSLYLCRDFKT